ncbi:Sialoadhesin Sialic acid-binding [Collichthys lucidus]|uniref:Sialoadhesin Sialic acid-binding n=1 Tax=Collichthys lucidus TaxID=240159 RepID=A0A4U5V5B2_COLLU|nr:Sialoadhesin Sialic acid-binding [Collichthys lucidus]
MQVMRSSQAIVSVVTDRASPALYKPADLLSHRAVGQHVKYPPAVCAVKGSSVTLPCTFQPLKSYELDGKEVSTKIARVRWCQYHLVCHLTSPSVYDSDSTNNDPRYKYLGDKTGSCTLQITDVQMEDSTTFRFRMEAEHTTGHFTGLSGVKVTVTDDVQVNVTSSTAAFRAGEAVTLSCTARCTFHQLEVTWMKDGHALPETGPALRLSSLTAKDSGNYTCSLKMGAGRRSVPYRLHVEPEDQGQSVDTMLLIRVILFSLHTVLIVVMAAVTIKTQSASEDDLTAIITQRSARRRHDRSVRPMRRRRQRDNSSLTSVLTWTGDRPVTARTFVWFYTRKVSFCLF